MFAAAADLWSPPHGWLPVIVWVLAWLVLIQAIALWEVRRMRRSDRLRTRLHNWTRGDR